MACKRKKREGGGQKFYVPRLAKEELYATKEDGEFESLAEAFKRMAKNARRYRMNKRGSAGTIFMVFSFLFLFGIGFIVFHGAFGDIADNLKSNQVFNQSQAAVDSVDKAVEITDNFDYLSVIVYLGFLLAIVVASILIDVHSVFFVIYIIILVIAVFVSAMLSYAWESFVSSSAVSASLTSFPITDFMLTNLPIFTLGAGVLSLIVTYAKGRIFR